ncbi:MAG: hypothetical protein ACRCYD_08470 [Plesiomonas sp.]
MNVRLSLFLGVIAIVLVGWLIATSEQVAPTLGTVKGDPSFWGNNMLTVVYDPEG